MDSWRAITLRALVSCTKVTGHNIPSQRHSRSLKWTKSLGLPIWHFHLLNEKCKMREETCCGGAGNVWLTMRTTHCTVSEPIVFKWCSVVWCTVGAWCVGGDAQCRSGSGGAHTARFHRVGSEASTAPFFTFVSIGLDSFDIQSIPPDWSIRCLRVLLCTDIDFEVNYMYYYTGLYRVIFFTGTP